MKLRSYEVEILNDIDGVDILRSLEIAGRVCYKSEENITSDSSENFIRRIIKSGHETVIEHKSISVRIICDRGVSHEIVRHRIASYSQESTRYCNYSEDKFSNQLTFIEPSYWAKNVDESKYQIWYDTMELIEKNYMLLIEKGATPQEARSILPNSLKTEIVVTMNLREWRHFFKLRTSNKAHPQMREIALELLNKFKESIPVIFEDISL